MNRITQTQLNNLVKEISELIDIPNSRDRALKEQKNSFLFLENAPIYGGYRLVRVGIVNGAHYGVLGGNGTEARRPAKEMYAFLLGIIEGIKHAQSFFYASSAGPYNGPMVIKGNTYE